MADAAADDTPGGVATATPPDKAITAKDKEDLLLEDHEEFSSDVETLNGRIVYNADGSAYLIEGDSDSEGGGGDDHLFKQQQHPQMVNALHIALNRFLLQQQRQPQPPDDDIPVTHSFRVYAAKDGLPPSARLRDHRAPPSKPVLMCFVCRLSFGYVRSFVAHATGEHALSLSETERDLLSSRDETVSCVIQGGVNEPLLSFLEPIITPASTAFNTNTSTSSSCGSPTNCEGALKSAPSECQSPTTDLATSCSTTLDYTSTTITTTSTTIAASSSSPTLSSTVINPTTNSPTTTTTAVASSSSAVPNSSSTSTTSNFTSCSTTSNSFVTTNNQSSSSYHNDNNSLIPELEDLANIEKMAEMAAMAAEAAAKSSPTTTPPTAPPAVTPSNGVYDGIYNATPRTSIEDIATNQTTINRTVLEDSSPRTVPNSKSPLSPQCAHHPDGKVNGVECPKCDMVLGSSRSLGGHMTMMHSRNSCKTLKCPKCNWHYKYQETLEIHMKEKHPENEMTCLYCVTNQAHPRLARGETYTCGYKPYRCEVCNYSTTTKGNLSIHMQSDKHINNVQELQTNEHMAVAALQQQQSQVQSQVQVQQQSGQQQAVVEKKQQQQQMGVTPGGTAKPKANWRCDVCNYETNVARNLRIHMTSEKHTHNLMVIQQNMKHMHHLQQAAAHPLDPQGAFPMLHPQLGFVTAPPGEPHLQPEAAIADMAYNHALLMMASQQHQQHQASQVNQVNQQRLLAAAVKSHQLAAMGGHSMGGPVMNGPLNLSIPPQMDVELGDVNGQKPDIPYEDCFKMFQCCVCTTYSSDSLESLSQHVQLDRSRLREDEVLAIVAGSSVCKLCSYKTNLKANFQLHCKTDKHLQRLHHVNHIKEGGARNEWKLKYGNMSNPVQARCNPCEFFTNSLHKLQLHASSPKHELNARLFVFLERAEAGLGAGTVKSYHCTACSVSVRTKVNLVQHAGTVLHARTLQALVQGEEPDMRDVFVVKEAKQAAPLDDDKDLNGSDISDLHHDDITSSDVKTSANKSPTNQDNSSMLKQALLDRTETAADSHNCPFCPFACSSEVRLQMHVVAQHGGQNRTQAPTLACPLCQDAFKDLTSLENHIMDTHNVNSEGVKRLMALVDKTEWLNSQNTTSSSGSQNTSTGQSNSENNASGSNNQSGKQRSDDAKDVKMDFKSDVKLPSRYKPTSNGPAAEEPSSAAINMVTNDAENDQVDVKQEVMDTDVRSGDESDEKEDEDTFTCTPCGRVFNQVEDLFCHQNELGHLEYRNNVNTGGKSGYLCWKKGCGMTFNTITSTQFHFKEVHANRTSNSVSSDRHVYKYRCTQCSLAFKTQEKLKLHAQYHLIRAATKCVLCGKSFRTVLALQKHVETSHASMSKEELQQYRNSLLNNPLLTGNANAGVIDPNTIELLKKESIKEDEDEMMIQDDNCEDMDTLEEGADEVVGPPDGKDQKVLEDYINSQAMAEDSYNDPNRKYKCHRCKVAFTRQSYLTSHNKTLLHRKGEKMNCTMEKYLDPNRPFKCEVCKESFTQKNILLVHYNSVSHLHKLKLSSLKENSTPNVISSSASPGSPTGGSNNNATPASPSSNETSEKKPYKCNLCKLSYSTSSTLDIHVRSVLHQSKASRIQELVLSGELDLSTPLVERPDSTPSCEASTPSRSTATNEQDNTRNVDSSNARSSTPVSAASKVSETMTPTSVAPATSVASGMAPFAFPIHPDHTNIMQQALNFMNQAPMSTPPYQCNKCGSMCSSHDALVQHQNLYCYFAQAPMAGMPNVAQTQQKPQEQTIKEEPSKTEIQRARVEQEAATTPSPMPLSHSQSQNLVQRAPTPGQQMFKSRYPFIRPKPLIFRHLLESFGFDVVMQFNESNQRRRKEQKDLKEEKKDDTNKEKPSEDKTPNDTKGADDAVINVENKENVKMDLPEINRSVCNKCNKDFSSIWVLKSHQEEAHKDIVNVKSVEKFAEAFKDYYDRRNNTNHPIEDTEAPSPTSSGDLTQTSSAPVTPLPTATPPTSSANMSNQQSTQDAVANHMAMTAQLQFNQLLMSMGMGLGLPMGMAHMGVPFGMNMHASTPLIPLMMPPPPLDPLMAAAAFGGHPLMAGAGADPNFFAAQQKLLQQQQINAVNQQKRARTRINDEQLKILRAYFDINNSPTEEQLLEMSERSGLQLKVIKHWFRNTLFKERQRNKDSPYNFNNPPSTFLNLEEYEKTGEAKITPINNQNGKDSAATPLNKDLNMSSSQNKESSSIGGQNNSSVSQSKDNIGNSTSSSLAAQNKESNIGNIEQTPKREIPDDKLVIDEGNNQSESSSLKLSQSNDLTSSKPDQISTSTPKRHSDTNNIYNMSGTGDMMADAMGIPTSSNMMLSMDLRTSLDSFNSSYGSNNMFQAGMMSFMAPGSVSPPTSESPHSTGNTPSSTPTPSCSGGGKRANRTRFTDYQIKVLQEFFESNAYPKDDDLEYLSKLLNLSPRVIVVWFQNARQKARKVYENQPPITTSQEDEAAGRFQRTPGLNYQCKKCLQVFQRYYELIKHQKSSCFKDENPLASQLKVMNNSGSEDRMLASHVKEQERRSMGNDTSLMPAQMKSITSATPEERLTPNSLMSKAQMGVTASTPTPNSNANNPSSNSQNGTYRCDKCALSFSRFELWREHQVVHLFNPTLFPPAGYQGLPQGVLGQYELNMGVAGTPGSSQKRKMSDDEESASDHPRDKRLRTTILPEQLDYLYQQYQVESNPSRKMLENIARDVGLKKRVVQVWFQNTRARERKGQFRAHQQVIHKRCPFCRALFKARSALESHLATRHADQYTKGDINIDALPDGEDNSNPEADPMEAGDTAGLMAQMQAEDMNKMGFLTDGASNSNNVALKRYYENSLRKLLDERLTAMNKTTPTPHGERNQNLSQTLMDLQQQSLQQQHHNSLLDYSMDGMGGLNKQQQQQQDSSNPKDLIAPLDLSKPLQPKLNGSLSSFLEDGTSRGCLDDTVSETYSESTDNMDDESNPTSPSGSLRGSGGSKRFRTQMTTLQLKVMKSIFVDYKTPSMSECETLGREIGLPKRVVQVWYQNARAKEKKARLAFLKTFGQDMEAPKAPEECSLCGVKYASKHHATATTLQEHVFSRQHIENLKKHIDSLKRLTENQEMDSDGPGFDPPKSPKEKQPQQQQQQQQQPPKPPTTPKDSSSKDVIPNGDVQKEEPSTKDDSVMEVDNPFATPPATSTSNNNNPTDLTSNASTSNAGLFPYMYSPFPGYYGGVPGTFLHHAMYPGRTKL